MHRASSLLFLALLVASGGCTLCTSCDDDTYAAYGGKWQRADRTYGRVGSAFTETGFDTSGGEELMATPLPDEIDGDPTEASEDESQLGP